MKVQVSGIIASDEASRELNQNLREMTLLNKISHLVTSSISLDDMVQATVNGIAEYLEPDLIIFFLKEDASLPLLVVGPQDSRYKFDSVPAHCIGECLCGLAAQDGQPKYSFDISIDPRCTMLECKEAGLQSFAALPLKNDNLVIGVLGLASANPRDFEKQSKLLETLAAEISLSLRNSLLLEEARKRNDELSKEVAARKHAEAELRRAHAELARRVEERTAELERAKDNLRFLTTQILSAQEKERQRISYELHDGLGQSLTVLKMQLRDIQKKMPLNGREREEFEVALNYINDIVESVRRTSKALSPSILKDMGLPTSLRQLFVETCNLQEMECSINTDDINSLLSPEAQIIIYRIFQEILNNIVKHAQASHIELGIKRLDDGVKFSARDNGIGFDVDQILDISLKDRGMGLAYMEEQIRMLGGILSIRSKEGEGTKINFTVPFSGVNEPG